MPIQLVLAARYLGGRKLRTFLTTLAIIFGVLVIFSMNTLLPTMLQAFQTSILSASGQVDVTITQKSGDTFAPRILNTLENIPGVAAASGVLEHTINLPADFYHKGSVSSLALTGIDPKAAQALHDFSVQQGRFLQRDDTNVAVITDNLAKTLGLKLGDTLSIPAVRGVADLKIVGIRTSQALPGSEPVWVSLTEAQNLLNLPNRINSIEIKLGTQDAAQRDAIRAQIQAAMGSDYQLGGLSSDSQLFASLQTAQQAFNLMGFLALFMGGFIIFNTFRTVVAERRHDIGMLRAIGANRRTIVLLFMTEGLLQGIVGTAIGIALGYGLGLLIIAGASGLLQQFLHIQLGAPVVEPSLIIITVGLGVGVTLLSGLLPALNASRVPPLEALRPAGAGIEARRKLSKGLIIGIVLCVLALVGLLSGNVALVELGGLFFLIGLVLIAPSLVKPIAIFFGALVALAFARSGTGALAEGNLTRQPSRAAITASATMIGLAIIVAVVGLISSLTGGMTTLIQSSLGGDYLLVPPSIGLWASNVGADETLADRLRATPGVVAVSTMRFVATSLNDQDVNLLGIDPVAFPRVAGLNFQAGEPKTAYDDLARGRAMIVNGITATQLGLHVGDNVKVSSPEGEQTYRLVAIANDFLNTKIMTAYISQANLKTDFHKTDDVFIQVKLAPNADRAQADARIKEIAARYPQFNLISGKAYLDQITQLLNATFSIYYILIVLLALPSLIAILNTLAIGVIERTREIGMLRAIGATRGQVRQVILAEALLLAATGTAFGLLAGLYLGYVIVFGLNATGIYPVTYAFPYAGILVAIAIGLLFGVAASIIPARQAAQLNIIQALRYE